MRVIFGIGLGVLAAGCSKEVPGNGSVSTVASASRPAALAASSGVFNVQAAPSSPSVEVQWGKCDEAKPSGEATLVGMQLPNDLRVTVKNYVTYCAANRAYSVRIDGTSFILCEARSKPFRVASARMTRRSWSTGLFFPSRKLSSRKSPTGETRRARGWS
jgi:hypothetical protein